jgi:hypothetical protein
MHIGRVTPLMGTKGRHKRPRCIGAEGPEPSYQSINQSINQPHSYFISALDESEWSTKRAGRFTRREETL